MSEPKLSAKEEALIAAARAALAAKPCAPVEAPPSPVPAPAESPDSTRETDQAERIAALFAAARAETGRLRERQRRIYVWAPVAFISVIGLWTLVWLWHRI